MDFVASLTSIDPETVMGHLPSWMLSDLARQVFLFTLAAWIHSGRVKKEIKTQFQTLADAIHGVESKLGPVIDNLDLRVKILESKNIIKGEL